MSNDPWALTQRKNDSSGGTSIPIELGSVQDGRVIQSSKAGI